MEQQDRVEAFLTRWQDSQGNERANAQSFFQDLCEALGVDKPPPKGSVSGDPYCFEKDVKIYHPSGKVTSGFIDFYKENHFLIEAKQGGTSQKGTAKRGTATYRREMEKAFVQAVSYTRHLPSKPPFLLVCDVGHHFELWWGFSGDYGGYAARTDIPLAHLQKPEIFALFVDIFTNPQAQNPEKIAAQVTREVAADLALLTKSLEDQHNPEEVALFLMRCIFTMFAEDVGLLKKDLFTAALADNWLKNPRQFKPQVEFLWQAMNDGKNFGYDKLLRFNGGLFANPTAFDLNAAQIEVLLTAAKRDWQNVEPAIFGTLLERALDKAERKKLGAHYTPRSYVERLVRPVVMEPLREQWELVQGEVIKIIGDAPNPTTAKRNKAVATLEAFLTELRGVRILDPACGTGNFLYVTMDLMKQLETEVLKRIGDITGSDQLRLDVDLINPSQFLGIEINPRASAIADLVIWIGYLQWHFRRFGDIPPVEPVLREYHNIENRDAVLAYDGTEPDIDPKTNKVRTRWGGRTMQHPVTGEAVPDPSDQIPILRYLNPRPAEWPEADYVVSNPPFIGNARMREVLGDGYVETLRISYSNLVPETADYVMYWWHKTATLLPNTKLKRFGLITTNSIRQIHQRKIIEYHLNSKKPIRIPFAIADHPWINEGAAVRIAMTTGELSFTATNPKIAKLGTVVYESLDKIPEKASERIVIHWKIANKIYSNLDIGIDLTSVSKLKSNSLLAGPGVKLHGSGFIVNQKQMNDWGYLYFKKVIKAYVNGKDLMSKNRNLFIIDFWSLTVSEAKKYSHPFQKVLDEVKPERDVNQRKTRRENWWLFGENVIKTRAAVSNLNCYIATPETAKHRVFVFLDGGILPDNMVTVIALNDAYFFGVLSSSIHVKWSLAAGGTLEDRPRYNKTVCFDPFPFPDPTPEQKQKIRQLGERLDAHRKQVQANHPDITITGMYNLLEKIKNHEPLTDKDREYNNRALVSILKQIHDDLDLAVFEAYGWEPTLSDEQILENLVKLNAERAEEERNGIIRWLRPEYQAPDQIAVQPTIEGIAEPEPEVIAPVEQQKLPTKFKDQLAAIRNLLRTQGGEWTLTQITAQFKNAKRQQNAIQDCLDSLTELGVIRVHTEEAQPRWYISS
jgi:hypothetical protein